MRPARIDRLFALLLLLYLGAAVWMALRLPAHAAPNEWLNYEYIVVMRETGRWPNRGAVDEKLRYTEWHQPPVYFTWAWLVGLPWPHPDPARPFPPYAFVPHSPDAALIDGVPPPLGFYDNPFFTATHVGNLNPAIRIDPAGYPTFYAARIAAALLGALAMVTLYAAGRAAYSPATGLLMASLLAFQPNFIHLSGAVNNDMPLTALATVTLALGTTYTLHTKAPRRYLLWGVAAALAILTKTNGVFLGAALAVMLLARLQRSGFVTALRCGIYAVLPIVGLWGAWLWRNARLTADTLGLQGSFPVRDILLQNPLNLRLLAPELPRIWRSFWLDWTAGDVAYPADWIYVTAALALAALLGGWLVRRPDHGGDAARRAKLRWTNAMLLAAAAAIAYLYFMVKAATIVGAGFIVPEGRWLLPVWPAVAWLAGVGMARWWPAARRETALAVSALVPPLATVLLLATLLPTLYPRAQRVAEVASAESPLTYADLRLHAVQPAPLTAGELSRVTRWWSLTAATDQDLVVSTQLLTWDGGGWAKQDEQNSLHGLGLSPTSTWQAGETWRDWVALRAPAVDQPTRAAVVITVLDANGAVAAQRAGEPVAFPVVAEGAIRPKTPQTIPPAARLAQPVRFGDQLELAGLTRDGDRVTLWWRALADVPRDFTVFVHAVAADGTIIVQSDAFPAGGSSPTRLWQAGDVVRDGHALPGAGSAALRIGVYTPGDFVRLPAVQGATRLPDDALVVAP